ncbi:TOM (translocase of outer membrane) complex component [Ophidiomyces ophidiicola]|nr:TOM (translocase of outer membrane) complex component [Ophidiomyces ophidiicola]KAI1984873.1 TOM (translocase of outer membrane) complex component [Ophidiomyces ophidiicola]KAI1986756.1 TOM (translocase of outer membrane) complex component [Ophidiomyces ophidiicola]
MSSSVPSQPVVVPIPAAQAAVVAAPIPSPSSSSLWDRVSKWASEHKAVVYTIAGVAVVVTSAGVVYYLSDTGRVSAAGHGEKRKSKKERRREKKKAEEEKKAEAAKALEPQSKQSEEPEELPEVDETSVEALDAETRALYASRLKAAGNKAFGSKDYNKAIELYGKAILCKPDPVFYSNRAACYNALSEWDKVVEDTTAAIAMDDEYVKAMNRRANAYEKLEKYSDALLDYTASCIIDGFANETSKQAVERLLKKLAAQKASFIMEKKGKKLPSATFVSNYLQSFRPKSNPEGLSEDTELDKESGMGQLRKGFQGIAKHTSDGYEEAARAFEKALELGELASLEPLALNMRATFTYLAGDANAALKDLNKSIELDPLFVQSYIKRASLHLEMGNQEAAADDFDLALAQNKDDPDIYYHRAQLHFILGELAEAAKDYQKSIDLDRDFIYSHIQLGVAQYKMGSVASAMATLRRTLKNFENVADVYNYYGELLLDQQKFSEAIEKFDRAVELEKSNKPWGINVLPLINKALALFQWKHDFQEAENLCQKALIIDPECDIAVATLAQLLLQQGKVSQALKYFERAAELARTEAEVINAISYAEATRAQLDVQDRYPKLAARLAQMGGAPGLGGVF